MIYFPDYQFFLEEKMKKIASVTFIAVLLVVLGAGIVFAAGGQQQSSASGEWKWERKITFISPWGPGGGSGPTIRNLTPLVQQVLNIPCEVNHVEGAGGANGAIAAQRQPADGYNFLLATQSQIILDLQNMLPFNFKDEFIPIAKLVHSTNSILASARGIKGKFSDFRGFIDYVKANPRELSVAMLSSGGTDEASLRQVLSLALNVPMDKLGDYLKITPYGSGSEVDAALIGGHIHLSIQAPGDSAGLIESGDIIPLVVLAEKRLASFPNIPATGQDYNIPAYIGTWRGIWARKGTPQAAIDAMEKAIEKAWNMKPYQDFCEAEGYLERVSYQGQADFRKLVDSEYKVFEEFLKATGQIK